MPSILSKLVATIAITFACMPLSAHLAFAQGGSITLDYTVGLNVYDSTQIPAGRSIDYYLRFTNPGTAALGMAHGWRVYSPDGATWVPATFYGDYSYGLDTTYLGIPVEPESLYSWRSNVLGRQMMFDGGTFVLQFSITGEGSDTIGLGGLVQQNVVGFATGADFVGFRIGLDSVPTSSVGRTICMDSSFFPPSGVWLWANGTSYSPAWDGPHCFEIVECCVGMRGNINHDNGDGIDISDLNMLVDFMFRGGPTPPCLAETNVNGMGGANPDIADLNYMVAFMFRNGPAPVACQ